MNPSNNTTSIQPVANCDQSIDIEHIEKKILTIRDVQVMMDKDLGKKLFGFTLMRDITATEIINRINGVH